MHIKIATSILLGFLLFIITGCGGGGGDGGNRNIGPTISNTSPATINEGEEATLSVSASDSDGFIREIRWRQTAGPNVSFTNGSSTITFTAPDVTEDTILGFSVDAVDDFGAIASVDFNVTVLNIEGTKAQVVINQVASVGSAFDHHWFEVENITDAAINLGEFSITTTGYDIQTNIATEYQFTLPAIELAASHRQLISLRVMDIDWSMPTALNPQVTSLSQVIPDWQTRGHIELIHTETDQMQALIYFNMSESVSDHGYPEQVSQIITDQFPMAEVFIFNRDTLKWTGKH